MLIGILGNAGAGKSTAAKLLSEQTGAKVVSFAYRLRKELKETFSDSNVNFFSGNKNKKICLNYSDDINSELKKLLRPYLSNNGQYWNLTLRKLLQIYGTDFRREQKKNYWIEKLFLSLNPKKSYIIDDVRFHNEAAMIQILGGFIIKIESPENNRDNHASESHISSIPYNIRYVQPNKNDISRLSSDMKFIHNCLKGVDDHYDAGERTSTIPSKKRVSE
jgi:hypothetical protein